MIKKGTRFKLKKDQLVSESKGSNVAFLKDAIFTLLYTDPYRFYFASQNEYKDHIYIFDDYYFDKLLIEIHIKYPAMWNELNDY